MMSSPAPIDAPAAPTAETGEPPPQDGWRGETNGDLAALRAALDSIDDTLHAKLVERALVVEQVAKSGKRSAYRPGREASIIRRLVARHTGHLPAQTLVRIWRELLAGTTAMQGAFTVAICETDANAGFTQVAREHFGALTPLRVHGGPAQAMADVSHGTAAVAVLPLPSDTEELRDAWWTALLHKDEPRIYVVARLPFWTVRPDSAPSVQALVIAANAPDQSERDRSLLGFELDLGVSRARLVNLLSGAGLQPGSIILRRDQGVPVAHALVEVEGYLSDEDTRLAGIDPVMRRPVVLGTYAVPINGGAA